MCGNLYSKDLELVFHKNFLQKLVDRIFPLNITESYAPSLQIPNMNGSLSLGYKIDVYKPVLTIFTNYIRLDATAKITSAFGDRVFPLRCKMVPVYNSANNRIELKTMEGVVDLTVGRDDSSVSLGAIDLSRHISNIKIPLQVNSILVQNKSVKPRFKNVVFYLYKDRIVMSSDVAVE
jgi:hypothetical protein